MMQPVPGIPLVEQADKLEKWRLDFEGVPSTINEKKTLLFPFLGFISADLLTPVL